MRRGVFLFAWKSPRADTNLFVMTTTVPGDRALEGEAITRGNRGVRVLELRLLFLFLVGGLLRLALRRMLARAPGRILFGRVFRLGRSFRRVPLGGIPGTAF